MMFTFGELTAGVGTGRLALEKLGCTPVWSCEIDPMCNKEFEEDEKKWKCDGEHSMISDTMSKCKECDSTKTQYSRITYHANFGEYPTYGNIRELKNPPYVDIIVSGFPCLSFSIAGQRKGFEDTRGEVFFEVARIINEVQPKAFILENVQGLLSHDKGRTFKKIKKILRDCGYILNNKLLNSTSFGVPQNRERVYFAGFRKDLYAPLIDGAFIYPKDSKLDKTIGDLLEENVDEKYYLSEKMVKCLIKHLEKHKKKGNNRGMKILNLDGISHCPITANYSRCPDDALILDAYNDKVRTDGICGTLKSEGNSGKTGHYIFQEFSHSGENGKGRGIREYMDVSPTLSQQRGTGGSNVPMVIQRNQRNEIVVKDKSGSVTETMGGKQSPIIVHNLQPRSPDRPSLKYSSGGSGHLKRGDGIVYSLDTGNCQAIETRTQLRKLTPLECFRLQGFPDKFVKKAIEAGISDTQLYRQAGNAFTLTVVEAVAEKVVKKLGELES